MSDELTEELTEEKKATTATAKKRGRPKKVHAETGPEAEKSDVDAVKFSEALATFGFTVEPGQVASWNIADIEDLRYKLNAWDAWRPGDDRAEVPQWLLAWDNPKPDALDEARLTGAEWRKLNADDKASDFNPWPVGTRLAQAWDYGTMFETSEVTNASNATPEVAPAVEIQPVTTVVPVPSISEIELKQLRDEVARLQRISSAFLPVTARERDALDIGYRIARLTPTVNEAEQAFEEASKISKEKKDQWHSLQKTLQELCTEQTAVLSGGEYQHKLPLDHDPQPDPPTATPAVAVETPKPVEVSAEPIDKGGELDLVCLLRSSLLHNCGPDCAAEGLTESKIELLKEAISGDTIKKLEAFQQANPDWWRIKGFGEKWIDRLQDAHLAIRVRYPVPQPGAAVIESTGAVEDVPSNIVEVPTEAIPEVAAESSAEVTNGEPVVESTDIEKSVETLDVPEVDPEAE